MNSKLELGKYLKSGRQKKGYTLMEVARYLDLETDSIIHHYESGFRAIPNKYLEEIADFLDLDLEKMVALKVKVEEEKIVSEVYGKGKRQ